MKLPKVHGIIATDLDGNIDAGGKSIAFSASEHVKELDGQILRSFISDMLSHPNAPTIVVGEETYRQMGGLLTNIKAKYNLVVSSKTGVTTIGRMKEEDYVETDDPASVAYCKAFSLATKSQGDIFVFGGRSVYNMFAHHYSRLFHVVIKDHLGDESSKKVKVIGLYSQPTPTQCLVYKHNQAGNTFCYINSSEIQVSEFNPTKEEA